MKELFTSNPLGLITLFIVSLTLLLSLINNLIYKIIDMYEMQECKNLVKETRNKSILSLFIKLLKFYKAMNDRMFDRYLKMLKGDVDKEQSTTDKLLSNKKQKSIVDEIYKKKKKQLNFALILVFVSSLLYWCINAIFHTDTKIEVLIILYVLFGLIIMSKLLVSYRIKKGYYGMNYEECKELIYYIMDDNDKNDKNKGKKIFNEIEDCNKVGQEVTVIVGELQY